MSDEELDKLFRETAEHHNVLYDPEAWQEMEARLNTGAAPAKAPGYGKWIITSVVLLVGVTVYFVIPRSENPRSNEISAVQPITDEAQPGTRVAEESTGILTEVTPASPVRSGTGDAVVLQDRSVRNLQQSGSEAEPAGRVNPAIENSIVQNRAASVPEVPATPVGVLQKEEKESDAPVSQSVLPGKADLALVDEESAVVDSAYSAPQDTIREEEGDGLAEKKDKSDGFRRNLLLGASLSPDLSSVNYFSPGKVGLNFGLGIEYRFAPHWSVQTGVVRSRKIYSSSDVDMTYSYGYYDMEVDRLEGDCMVLDIPVNVYYRVNPGSRFRILAGAGLSSYLMLSEDYGYSGYLTSGTYQHYEQHVEKKNNHWFGLMNLSLGIEHDLSGRLSMQVEPFVKAPLAGVGEGKVSLVSAGAFFHLKYRLVQFDQ